MAALDEKKNRDGEKADDPEADAEKRKQSKKNRNKKVKKARAERFKAKAEKKDDKEDNTAGKNANHLRKHQLLLKRISRLRMLERNKSYLKRHLFRPKKKLRQRRQNRSKR